MLISLSCTSPPPFHLNLLGWAGLGRAGLGIPFLELQKRLAYLVAIEEGGCLCPVETWPAIQLPLHGPDPERSMLRAAVGDTVEIVQIVVP
jgi:hypothetical protein